MFTGAEICSPRTPYQSRQLRDSFGVSFRFSFHGFWNLKGMLNRLLRVQTAKSTESARQGSGWDFAFRLGSKILILSPQLRGSKVTMRRDHSRVISTVLHSLSPAKTLSTSSVHALRILSGSSPGITYCSGIVRPLIGHPRTMELGVLRSVG